MGIKKHVLNNKCSAAMKSCIQGNGITYELVPPGQHRESNPNLQIPFHLHPGRRRRQIPTITVVPPPRTSRTHLKSSTPVQSCTKRIRIRARPWQPRLYEETICSHRLRDSNPCQARRPLVMGHTIRARIQPGHLDETPSLFPSLCHQDESNEDQRHCFFQAPVHNQPNHLT